jgi:Glucodextranase, domain B
MSLKNLSTNAAVTGEADGKGAFAINVPLGTGTNTIEVTATDPAGNSNVATVTVRHGTGKLSAKVTASFFSVKLSRLPEPVTLTVSVTDPDGQPLPGANVTFTLAVPGVPAIASSVLSTGANGRVSFSTTIPKGATVGQCSITAIVQTGALGDTTPRTVINIVM